ncbi:MAG: hypothetical protein KF914_12540 [Rhizobiaceae bacterium]|nr:hypothetical protein [Rhizobiaceae bacterium]
MLLRYLSRFDDGEVIRWAFRGLLIGAIGVLSIDLYDLWRANQMAEARLAPPIEASPVLPPAVEGGTQPNSSDPRPFLTTESEALRQPIRFTLEAGGVLKATGSIEAGAADRFAAEIAVRGEYVKTVALDSPGGALEDAMSMARLIRERGLSTEVSDGALCASSCPLVFAGGTHRRAGEKAALGVHQFYAAGTEEIPAAQVMADAQSTTARITRHLSSMDVDPALWLHALDTPPRALYYFSRDELARFRLVTPD